MSDCIFCSIAAGRIPAKLLYEDDDAVAFDDLHPQAPVHALVIPRRHIVSLAESSDADAALLGHLQRAAVAVAKAKGLAAYRVVTNSGAEAGQSVFHLHLHVLGGRPMQWPPG